MTSRILVKDAKEAALIRAGLSDPVTLAVVKIIGALKPLKSDRARKRVMEYVEEELAERDAERAKS